jgi:protein ImuA
MKESIRLSALKQSLSVAHLQAAADAAACPLGAPEVDGALGGGLAVGRLHEIFAANPADEGSAMGFAAMATIRLLHGQEGDPDKKSILWLREEKVQRHAGLYGPGLAEIGLDPARVILGVLPDVKALLRASADILRSGAVGALILELSGNPPLLDLTVSRRLALAAERSGITPLLLRLRGATPMPSAAQTRWGIGAAPSVPLEAGAPGLPALSVSLLRQRGGPAGFDWILEWNRDAALFRPAALFGPRLPLSGGRSLPAAGAAEAAGWRIAS